MNFSGEIPPPPPTVLPPLLPPHHHHHHHHPHQHFNILPNCPLHGSVLTSPNQNHHSPSCPLFSSFPAKPAQFSGDFNLPESNFSDAMMIQQENLEEEPDDEEEPIFVLTDEWREFFAKSEAKRKLAKKQARKRKN